MIDTREKHPQTIANEQYIISRVHEMCEESLSPEVFEMWEAVKQQIESNRHLTPPALNGATDRENTDNDR